MASIFEQFEPTFLRHYYMIFSSNKFLSAHRATLSAVKLLWKMVKGICFYEKEQLISEKRSRQKNHGTMNTWQIHKDTISNLLKKQFLEFVKQIQEYFLYFYHNGSTVLCNNNESTYITDIVLCVLHGALDKQKNDNKLSKITALARINKKCQTWHEAMAVFAF